jgi:putative salt-induced outer membrane protein YdiY
MRHDKRSFFRLHLLVFLASLIPALAHAQAPPPPPPDREGSADFAFVGTTGNSSTQTIGLGAEYIWRPAPWETRFKTTYVRNKAEDELRAQSFLFTARGQRPIKPRLSGYAQYGYLRDRFAGILNRNTVEGGITYLWVDQTPHKLFVDGGLGYANEERLLGEDRSSALLTAGGLYTLKISDTSELSEDGHLAFSLNEGSDWRYTNIVSLTAKITTIFSLKVSNTVRYLNLPVPGFKSTDAITSVALVAKF